jgi:hypothetical protein
MVKLHGLFGSEEEGNTLIENVPNYFTSHNGVISQKI